MRVRVRVLVVGLVLVGLALGGCAEPQQASTTLPTAPPTTAAPAEPTLEPLGPADFPVPAEAREQTEAGAVAMAIYYLDLIDYISAAMATGSVPTDSLRDLSDGCEVCEQIASGFDAAVAAGNRYEGADLTPQPGIAATVNGSEADVVWVVDQSVARSIGPDGQILRESPATVLRGGVVLEWNVVRAAWIATQMNLVQS